jgi:nucleoside-diphosphate-sugar epimerase
MTDSRMVNRLKTNSPVFVTGGAGFFGGLLKKSLLNLGIPVVSLDLTSLQGDICDEALMASLFDAHRFETVYHCAAILAHVVKDRNKLWSSNVDGTRITAETARRYGTKSLLFTSSNSLWGHSLHRLVREDDTPSPVEIYGRSKWEGEKILRAFDKDMNVTIIRCPTIVDEGRLGLLTILFDFIREGRKVWVLGGGENRYQFIYAKDLIDACLLASQSGKSNLFHIGSDEVKTFREVYNHVILHAGTGARVAALPKTPLLFAMRAAHALGLSPLGPYQYKMIAEDFVFDTSRIKAELGWRPTLKNEEMLALSYRYYADHFDEIHHRTAVSAHKQAAKMGIIHILKMLS